MENNYSVTSGFDDLLDDVPVIDVTDQDEDLLTDPPEDSAQSSEGTKINSDLFDDLLDDKDLEELDHIPQSDLINQSLIARGINPEAIKFYNDEGEIEEVKFSDLTKEEQIALLNSETEQEEIDLSENEQEALEFLRENNMSIKELAQKIREKTIEEMKTTETEQNYSVDDFDNDELFIADFKNKYGDDFTEEELAVELEKEKANPELFEKKVNKLRADYKAYEDEVKENERKDQEAKLQQEQEDYVNNMVAVAGEIKSMHDTVELDDKEKSEILSFMFNQDTLGKSGIQKAFEDPKTLFKVAWYLKHGDETINELHKYYQGEIAKISKGNKSTKTPSTVVKPQKQHTTKRGSYGLDDLLNN